MCEYNDGGEDAVDSITIMGRMQQIATEVWLSIMIMGRMQQIVIGGMCEYNDGEEDAVVIIPKYL